MNTVRQPGWMPTNKLLAQSIVTIILFVLAQVTSVDYTPEIELAGSVVVGFVISYFFVKDRDNTPSANSDDDDDP